MARGVRLRIDSGPGFCRLLHRLPLVAAHAARSAAARSWAPGGSPARRSCRSCRRGWAAGSRSAPTATRAATRTLRMRLVAWARVSFCARWFFCARYLRVGVVGLVGEVVLIDHLLAMVERRQGRRLGRLHRLRHLGLGRLGGASPARAARRLGLLRRLLLLAASVAALPPARAASAPAAASRRVGIEIATSSCGSGFCRISGR